MNYTTNYNRGNLSVVHPQLDHVMYNQKLGEYKSGRKRFPFNKNIEGFEYIKGQKSSEFKALPLEKSQSPVIEYKPSIKFLIPDKINKEVQVDNLKVPNEEVQDDESIENPEKNIENIQENEEEKLLKEELAKKEKEINELKKNFTKITETGPLKPTEIYT